MEKELLCTINGYKIYKTPGNELVYIDTENGTSPCFDYEDAAKLIRTHTIIKKTMDNEEEYFGNDREDEYNKIISCRWNDITYLLGDYVRRYYLDDGRSSEYCAYKFDSDDSGQNLKDLKMYLLENDLPLYLADFDGSDNYYASLLMDETHEYKGYTIIMAYGEEPW